MLASPQTRITIDPQPSRANLRGGGGVELFRILNFPLNILSELIIVYTRFFQDLFPEATMKIYTRILRLVNFRGCMPGRPLLDPDPHLANIFNENG